MKKRVLLVEDDEALRESLSDQLVDEDYAVDAVADGDAGFERGSTLAYDLIVLDVKLPHRNGFDVCRDLRKHRITTPILMLTAKGETLDRVLGLKLGADDYLVKPFEPMELLARMEALLRRATIAETPPSREIHEFGAIRLDVRRGSVERDGKPIALLPLEYKLLCYFLQHRDTVLTRNQLLDDVWGVSSRASTRAVDVYVASLREKIEVDRRNPRHVVTVHRRGYKFIA